MAATSVSNAAMERFLLQARWLIFKRWVSNETISTTASDGYTVVGGSAIKNYPSGRS